MSLLPDGSREAERPDGVASVDSLPLIGRCVNKGLSIPAHRKAIAEYAAAHDVQILETCVEAASSYQDESKRVEFQRMCERAKSDPRVGVVLVHESSRFCRHPWRTPQLIGELQEAGVKVVSATEPGYDVNTVMGMWMQKVMEAKNASYSMEVAFHTRKGMRQNANACDPESGWCYKNGGRPSWGYRTVRIERTDVRGRPRFKAIWDLNREEVAGRPVWEWTREVLVKAAGGASLDGLQDMLNEAGVSSPSGGYWSASTIHSPLEPHMLLQYAGDGTWAVRRKRRRKWNEPGDWEVVPSAHPAIISEDEAKVIGKAREAARARHANRCQEMAARVNRRLGAEWKAAGGAEAAAVRQRMARIESKVANIRKAVEDGLGDAGWANTHLGELAQERARLAAAVGDAPAPAERPHVDAGDVATYLIDVRRLLSHANDQERRVITRQLVEAVTLDPDERTIEVKVKLPANAVQRMEAAARIVAIHTLLAARAHVRLLCVPGKGRRPAEVLEVTRW